MTTTLNLSPDELTIELLERIKNMFADSKRIEIEIRDISDIQTTEKKEHKERLTKAVDHLENRDESKAFSKDELKMFSNLLKI